MHFGPLDVNFALECGQSVLLGIAGIAFTLFAARVWRSGRRGDFLPPGPPTVPILGNIHQLKRSYILLADWDYLQDLIPKYGSLISLVLGTRVFIVVQDDGAIVRELFDKRGAIYNSRLPSTVFSLATPYFMIEERDPVRWRLNRKLILQQFHSSLSNKELVVRAQQAETSQMLEDLLHSPERHQDHLLRFAISVLTETSYGFRTPTPDHFAVRMTRNFWMKRTELFPWYNSPPVDLWPLLKYIPDWLISWRQRCLAVKELNDKVFGTMMDTSRSLYTEGHLDPTVFAHKLFREQEKNRMNDRWTMMVLAGTLEGGATIVSGSITTAILALLTHPDVQAKAHAEIDRICDDESLPTMLHYQSMSYVRSVVKETLRWRPPFPLGLQHELEQDDEYLGYRFPKGSGIVINIWAIHQNLNRYQDPTKFMPERFETHTQMSGDYMSGQDHRTRDHFAFGTGRRGCPGAYIAEQAIFLAVAKILWAFTVSPPLGTSHLDIDTDARTAFKGFGLRVPKKFDFVLTPRSERRIETLTREMERVRDERVSAGFTKEAEEMKDVKEGYKWKETSRY